jgi:hypothetical protein
MNSQIYGVANLDGTNLGGGFNGISIKQPKNSYRDFADMADRRILVKSWNTIYATGNVNGRNRVVTPFRAVNSLGDFLARQNYICGGANEVNATKPGYGRCIRSAQQQCDGTGIPATAGNCKFVPDSSDYTRYKRQRAFNRNYNDNKFGGDESHASYVPVMAARRR